MEKNSTIAVFNVGEKERNRILFILSKAKLLLINQMKTLKFLPRPYLLSKLAKREIFLLILALLLRSQIKDSNCLKMGTLSLKKETKNKYLYNLLMMNHNRTKKSFAGTRVGRNQANKPDHTKLSLKCKNLINNV